MAEQLFTREYAWAGASYDLAMDLGPRDDVRLGQALRTLWTHADLAGCYLDPDREPHDQARVDVDASSLETRLHGVAQVGSSATVACDSVVIRYDDGNDWLHFCLPMGSLGYRFDVGGYPFGDSDGMTWRRAVDEWLCNVGRRVFDAVPFRLALIGFEGGELKDVEKFYASGVPEQRWLGYLVPRDGHLQWFAPN